MPLKSVPIELGGQTRHLRYDFNALTLIEEELGLSITELGQKLTGPVRLKDFRTIIWAGLYHEDSSLTQIEVGEMLNDLNAIPTLSAKVGEAFALAFPVPDAQKN